MEDEAQRLSYDKGRMLALQTQAAIYSHKKERKRSLEIYDQVIQSGIMTDNEVIRILHRMSRSLINTKEFDKALMNIERSDSVVNKIKLERPDAAERFRNLYLEHLGLAPKGLHLDSHPGYSTQACTLKTPLGLSP